MNMVIPDEGKLKWLYWAVGTDGSDLEDFEVHTYQNNYTPVDGSSDSDFTESTYPGYVPYALDRADFGAPIIVGGVAYITATVIPTFVCTGGGGELCYGWYLEGIISGKVLAAQRFDNTRTMAPGATEALDPFKIGLQTLH